MVSIPPSRLSTGMSLIELIFSAMIVGLAAAGISGLVLLNNMSSLRTFNKVDSLNAARAAVERLNKDVRDSQMIGGQFSTSGTQFPSPENPTYGAGQTPPGGWPSAPWPVKPYTLSNTCLILQLPVFYLNPINDPLSTSYNPNAAPDANNGYPSRLDEGYGNPAPGALRSTYCRWPCFQERPPILQPNSAPSLIHHNCIVGNRRAHKSHYGTAKSFSVLG